MKKIIFIIPTLSNGGAEKVISKITSGLCNNYETILLNFYCSENEYLLNENVKRIILSHDEIQYKKISRFKRLKMIRKIIKQESPDKIICFLNYVCIYTFLALLFTRYIKKIIFTERCNQKYYSKIMWFAKRLFTKFINKIILQNSGQQFLYSNYDKKKGIIIPNPIDERYLEYKKEFSNIPKHIVSIGRLTDQKDYPLAINAFNNVLKKHPDLIYHIYGKGEDKERIESLIKDLNLEGKVILEGFTTDINKVYENADIYLMTSKFEGMPNALAESLAVGIPSISTDCEFGPSDLIDNENMGILVNEHSVEAVEKSLIYMIENYNYYVSKSNYVKATMKERYSLDKITNEWVKVLEK